MTFKEAAQQKRQFSDYEWENYIDTYCPYMVGLEGKSPCVEMNRDCKKCWEREMPNAEQWVDKEKEWFINGFKKGEEKGLECGRNDAWELAKKISSMKDNEFDDAFGNVYREDVFNYYTPQEALAKLKAYEEAQNKIEVGDVVELPVGTKCVVTSVKNDRADGFTEIGYSYYDLPLDELKKTGKHIDIQSILEQIGE